MTFNSAKYFCDTATTGGYSDWRLPTAKEIFSILNQQRTNPAIDVSCFSPTTAEYWWSSDRQVNDTSKIWCANAGGGIGNHRMSETISAGGTKRSQVRAVRETSIPLLIINRFTDLFDGTVLDSLSGLQWSRYPSSDSVTWEEALVISDSITCAGYTDWRLPNIKELQSLNDERLYNPSLPTSIFALTLPAKYWSSSSLSNQNTKAWYLDSRFGITTYDDKLLRHYLLFVRSYNLTPTIIEYFHKPEKRLILYPNPFSTELKSNGDDATILFDVRDSQGKILFSRATVDQIAKGLNPGTYFFRISDSTGEILKLVKIE
ncbi:MAG: DUF1566 domain-containing protein [Bacteroidota bacterium]